MYLTNTKILSMLGTGYFLKITNINSQQEKPVLITKISSRKTQKNRQSAKTNFTLTLEQCRFFPQ